MINPTNYQSDQHGGCQKTVRRLILLWRFYCRTILEVVSGFYGENMVNGKLQDNLHINFTIRST